MTIADLRKSRRILLAPAMSTESRERIVARHERIVVGLVLDAVREHLACACDGIDGHLNERGLERGR